MPPGDIVAPDLSVSAHTVTTLRKRDYTTLEITMLNERFALCLGAVKSI